MSACVEISAENISFLFTDLNGSELDAKKDFTRKTKRKTTPEAICGYIAEELKALSPKAQKSASSYLPCRWCTGNYQRG